MREEEKQQVRDELIRRGQLTLAQRHEPGRTVTATFAKDGWVYQEFPTGLVYRCCPLDQYVAADWPELDVDAPWV